ncbi:hypothetical protein [Streptomyces sp. DHE17-7]|uniref:hypothetical protein n=1 Tax=Streptomyces sp. DHE17-7 TaxID=2759949 RepID=UPI0022EB76FE|nr:hypothetical protein [Streptomyces sp. DHE17-7]
MTRRLGDGVGTGGQLVTIAAVLVGALTTHLTNHLMERSRNRHRLLTRWDDKKVDAYGEYVDAAKMRIAASVRLYEARENLREDHRPEEELREDLAEAGRRWGSAFERVMLLGGDEAIEAGHELNKLVAEIDWQATGRITGTLEEWRERHRAAFRAINAFHEEAAPVLVRQSGQRPTGTQPASATLLRWPSRPPGARPAHFRPAGVRRGLTAAARTARPPHA